MTDLPEIVTKYFPDHKVNHYDITGTIGEGAQGVVLRLENGDGKIYTGKFVQRRLSLTP